MKSAIKSFIRRVYYRSRLCRLIVGIFSVATRRTGSLGISHLLSYAESDALGPLQRDEAMALFGIIRTLDPKTVVEFGFYHGHSAFNFLCALAPDARLYSYDIAEEAALRARREFSFDRRLTFIRKSQAEFDSSDIANRPIDFVFFDGAHDLALNIATFARVLPHLAPGAMLAVHDTGLWEKSHFCAAHERFSKGAPGGWVTETLYAHQPDERAFVNWVTTQHPRFGAIHFHTTNRLRHGFSLFQLQAPLQGVNHGSPVQDASSMQKGG